MFLNRLLINNFRNISSCDIKLSQGFNLFYGKNGSGKTSILESISYLALARSFRGTNPTQLIQHGTNQFTLFSSILDDDSKITNNIGILREKRNNFEISINGNKIKRILDIVDLISLQIIHPQGIDLILDGPELRRNFIDWGVYYSNPKFKKCFYAYKNNLKQRNALLKSKCSLAEFEFWDNSLANLAVEINNMRVSYIQNLSIFLNEIIEEFLPNLKFKFTLYSGWENSLDLRSILASNLERDRLLGYTCNGCHRADLRIKVDSFSASSVLSRGQLKLLVCAMRLAQGLLFKNQTGRNCIFLLDDLNSELDINSQSILLKFLQDCKSQVFITNIDKETLIPKGTDLSTFLIEDGSVFVNN